jgi:ribosomal-protein-alanine N-acetyltransferase
MQQTPPKSMSLKRAARQGSVRTFEPRDAQAVEQIASKCPEAATWSSDSYRELDRRGQSAWVVEADGSVCGFVVARTVADQGEILNLAVEPASRHAGNASGLLQRAIAEFRRQGITDVFLEVRESNSAGISFYENHDFVRTGQRPGYYQNPAEAAVLMMRKLTG